MWACACVYSQSYNRLPIYVMLPGKSFGRWAKPPLGEFLVCWYSQEIQISVYRHRLPGYQSNCITVTMFISTYLFVTTALSNQNHSQLPTTLKCYHHCLVSVLILLWPSTGTYGDLQPSTSRTQFELAFEPFPLPLTPQYNTCPCCELWPKVQIMALLVR